MQLIESTERSVVFVGQLELGARGMSGQWLAVVELTRAPGLRCFSQLIRDRVGSIEPGRVSRSSSYTP